MATVLVGVYDPEPRRLTFALAGHLPPLIAAAGRASRASPRPSPARRSAWARRSTSATSVEIPPGATLVLYTDGLIEDRSAAIDEGMEALRRALIEIKLPPDAVCDHVLQARWGAARAPRTTSRCWS